MNRRPSYAGAYRTVLADVEGAVTAWARTEAEKTSGGGGGAGGEEGGEGGGRVGPTKPPPKVVVVGHSLGGALAALCSARLAHDPDVLSLAGVQPKAPPPGGEGVHVPNAVECVTFGQPRAGSRSSTSFSLDTCIRLIRGFS